MKVWVLEDRWSKLQEPGMWNGDGLMFTSDLQQAVWFVRKQDADRVLRDNGVLQAEAVEKEIPDRGEPGVNSPMGGVATQK